MIEKNRGILIRYYDIGALEIIKHAMHCVQPNIKPQILESHQCLFLPFSIASAVITTLNSKRDADSV